MTSWKQRAYQQQRVCSACAIGKMASREMVKDGEWWAHRQA